MKRLLSLLMALAMTASLAACGGSGDTDDTETGAGAETQEPAGSESVVPPVEDLTDVDTSTIPGLEDGVFTVGMECAYAPYNWTQMDDSNGAVPISNVPGAYANGYDVMIAQRICDAYGWDLEIVSSAWDSLTPAVQSGTMDANIAGQSMTADRMAEVDMAGPYYYATIVVLICFMFAMMFFLIGIIGEYIAILFTELKDRPVYIVDETRNFEEGEQRVE